MAEAINDLGEGLKNALQEQVKSEQMKADLITNVSHDLKTPVTAIKGLCGGDSGRSGLLAGEVRQVYQNHLQ